jgi:hypothetical protein
VIAAVPIAAIMTAHPMAARNPALTTPTAARAAAITSIGTQQAIIIQPCTIL